MFHFTSLEAYNFHFIMFPSYCQCPSISLKSIKNTTKIGQTAVNRISCVSSGSHPETTAVLNIYSLFQRVVNSADQISVIEMPRSR